MSEKTLLLPFIQPECRSINLRKLQQIVGKLNHLADAWWCGRVLLRSAYNLVRDTNENRRWAHLNSEVKSDWTYISELLQREQWVSLELVLRELPLSHVDIQISTDACLSGFGAYCNGRWLTGKWPDKLKGVDIQILETWHLFWQFPLGKVTCHLKILEFCYKLTTLHWF